MKARHVWFGVNQYGLVVVTDNDIESTASLLDALGACATVGELRALAARYPQDLAEAIEAVDDDELDDDDAWNEEMMPGYEDGYWPPRYELGMAEMFTDEQFNVLVQICDAKMLDHMGGSGEALQIPEEHVDRVGELLNEWGFKATRANDSLLG